jgi:hypothetical protein
MKTVEEWIAKWNETRLLTNLPEEKVRPTACALSNQIGYNERSQFLPAFQRLSIPILRRVFGGMKAKNVTSKLVETPTKSHVVNLDPFNVTELQYDGHGGYNLEFEAQRTAEYCVKLAEYIDELASKVDEFVLLGIGWNGSNVVLYTE